MALHSDPFAAEMEQLGPPPKPNGAGERHYSGDRWPALVPITTTLPPVEPFAPEMLPACLRGYVLDVADRQQAPPDFAAVAAVIGLAAVLGNKVRIRPKQHDDWTVTPNLWGKLVGRPSAMKTPSMQAALALIFALQDEMRERWKASCADAELDGALAGFDAKHARREAEKLFKAGIGTGPSGCSPMPSRTRRAIRPVPGSW